MRNATEQQGDLNTRVVEVKVHLGGEVRVFPVEQIVGMQLMPGFVAVAVRRDDGKITRFVGFPVEITDEESMIQIPT